MTQINNILIFAGVFVCVKKRKTRKTSKLNDSMETAVTHAQGISHELLNTNMS